MKTSPHSATKSDQRTGANGYSLIELLVMVAVISSVVAVFTLVTTELTSSTRAGKLNSDVVSLNNAVRAYLVNGGRIPATAGGQDVINRLKRTTDPVTGKRLAGLRGSMIDLRLQGELVTVAGVDRAVWNSAKQRFEVRVKGTGFSGFNLDGEAAAY